MTCLPLGLCSAAVCWSAVSCAQLHVKVLGSPLTCLDTSQVHSTSSW